MPQGSFAEVSVLFWVFRVVLQQNERFSEIEEKYNLLQGKTASLFVMEEEVLKVSKKVRLMYSGTAVLRNGGVKGSIHPNYRKTKTNFLNQLPMISDPAEIICFICLGLKFLGFFWALSTMERSE